MRQDLSVTKHLLDKLSSANKDFADKYPGLSATRQPVHTLYGGAHLFKSDSCKKLGLLARSSLADYAPDAKSFALALGLTEVSPELADKLYQRVLAKLEQEAVEDYRIDFEDGYGYRSDIEEDNHARSSAFALYQGMKEKNLPPYVGIRVKALTEESKYRSARTLELFVATFVQAGGPKLPDNFVVTLPKVTVPEQVATFVQLLKSIEEANKLEPDSLKLELMVEHPHAIINSQGLSNLSLLVEAAAGRCRGAHFGTYDYTAACDITCSAQSMSHPACDFARHMMQVSLAGTGIWLSDGATNILPVGPHRARYEELTAAQKAENTKVFHNAWQIAYEQIRGSLYLGFYQGWDLHPSQLPVRYAANYSFFIEGLAGASQRLRAFLETAFQATLASDVFDDAASGQGLLNYFFRAINCGAIAEADLEPTGLTFEEIQRRSFAQILNGRLVTRSRMDR